MEFSGVLEGKAKGNLQVLRLESCPFRNSGRHSETQLVILVKAEHEIRPTRTGKCAVRPGLPFKGPPDPNKR